MLVRITNACRMGCSHCMVNAVPDGGHMTIGIFKKVISFTKDVDIPLLIISGGEPLEHPEFFKFIRMAKDAEMIVRVLSNGQFLSDESLRERVFALNVPIQVTNDSRFYPERINEIDHPMVTYEHELRVLTPLGRALDNNVDFNQSSPMCFNIRSVTRKLRSLNESVKLLRSKGKFCTPSINIDGSISVGESVQCAIVGTVDSNIGSIAQKIMSLSCNVCGRESDLTPEYKAAIGL